MIIDLALVSAMTRTRARTLTDAAQRTTGTTITLVDPRGRDRALLARTQARAEHLPIVYGIETALTPHWY